jgi:hypothetical protein
MHGKAGVINTAATGYATTLGCYLCLSLKTHACNLQAAAVQHMFTASDSVPTSNTAAAACRQLQMIVRKLTDKLSLSRAVFPRA